MPTKKSSKRPKVSSPTPLLSSGKPVDWWFVFKFNSAEEPGEPKPEGMTGIFDVKGWKRPTYESNVKKYSQHYAFASSANPSLQHGNQILGTSTKDPLGATFAQVYLADDPCYYVLWNDQFYGDPLKSGGSPWGHSKGMLAWDEAGEGLSSRSAHLPGPAPATRRIPASATATHSGSSRMMTSR